MVWTLINRIIFFVLIFIFFKFYTSPRLISPSFLKILFNATKEKQIHKVFVQEEDKIIIGQKIHNNSMYTLFIDKKTNNNNDENVLKKVFPFINNNFQKNPIKCIIKYKELLDPKEIINQKQFNIISNIFNSNNDESQKINILSVEIRLNSSEEHKKKLIDTILKVLFS